MFVDIKNNKNLTTKYIRSVTFYLDSSYSPRGEKVSKAPFQISRFSSCPSKVEIEIEFQSWTKQIPVHKYHYLSFYGNGAEGCTQNLMIAVDSEDDVAYDDKQKTIIPP